MFNLYFWNNQNTEKLISKCMDTATVVPAVGSTVRFEDAGSWKVARV